MKSYTSILFLALCLTVTTANAQTPFDSFAPETSRPMLGLDAITARETLSQGNGFNDSITSTESSADDISKWLSVDPLADKYPNISPYAYCSWNPVKYVDPDGRIVVYNDETGDCESMIKVYCSQSDMYNTVYEQLVESENTYTFQFGETKDDVAGQFAPSRNGGAITLNREGRWESAIPEETFHALQRDNKGKYNKSQLNLEFEAKVFVIMSGLPTGSYYGMDEDYYTSLLKMDIKEFTQPQSISEYIKQANIYSNYNSKFTIGGPSYWTPTTISPFNLISIIKRQK